MISGDADLYVNSYKTSEANSGASAGAIPFPTRDSFIWRSSKLGDDNVKISHRDPKFCYDCVYLIGVFGYQNSTYTLLGGLSESQIISLTLNRPQFIFGAPSDKMKYFSVFPSTSVDDISISATSLSSG